MIKEDPHYHGKAFSKSFYLGKLTLKDRIIIFWKGTLNRWIKLLNPFNWRCFFYNTQVRKGVGMAYKIGYDGKFLYLLDENNKPLPKQVSMDIHEGVNECATATVKFLINIDEFVKIKI